VGLLPWMEERGSLIVYICWWGRSTAAAQAQGQLLAGAGVANISQQLTRQSARQPVCQPVCLPAYSIASRSCSSSIAVGLSSGASEMHRL
jgi:hypothetical protein